MKIPFLSSVFSDEGGMTMEDREVEWPAARGGKEGPLSIGKWWLDGEVGQKSLVPENFNPHFPSCAFKTIDEIGFIRGSIPN